MILFAKHISVNKALDVKVLSSRATARHLVETKIKNSFRKNIFLDFENIDFVSRSFFDELNSQLESVQRIHVQKTNMNEQVKEMDSLILSSRSSRDNFELPKAEYLTI